MGPHTSKYWRKDVFVCLLCVNKVGDPSAESWRKSVLVGQGGSLMTVLGALLGPL